MLNTELVPATPRWAAVADWPGECGPRRGFRLAIASSGGGAAGPVPERSSDFMLWVSRAIGPTYSHIYAEG